MDVVDYKDKKEGGQVGLKITKVVDVTSRQKEDFNFSIGVVQNTEEGNKLLLGMCIAFEILRIKM